MGALSGDWGSRDLQQGPKAGTERRHQSRQLDWGASTLLLQEPEINSTPIPTSPSPGLRERK